MEAFLRGRASILLITFVMAITAILLGHRGIRAGKEGRPAKAPGWVTACAFLVLAIAVLVISLH